MSETDPPFSQQFPYAKATAEIYDEIYAWKDYEQESDRLKAIIARYLRTDGSKLLDIACGTGNHLVHLEDSFEIIGLDKSQEQLAAASSKVPSAEFVCADMVDFRLDLQFDIVVCLFRSIGYMTKLPDMRAAIQNMADHLRSGGLLILEPHLTPQEYRLGHLSARHIDKPDLKISRMFIGQIQDDQSVWELHHLIGRPQGVEYFVERHVMGLYTDEQYDQAIKDAGLHLELRVEGQEDEGTCTLLAATKP